MQSAKVAMSESQDFHFAFFTLKFAIKFKIAILAGYEAA
jgi:hypothetical protein